MYVWKRALGETQTSPAPPNVILQREQWRLARASSRARECAEHFKATGSTRSSATVLAVTVADSPVGPSGTSRRKAHLSTRSLDAPPRSHHRAAAASSAAWLYTRAARPAVLQHAARTRHATHGTHGRSASSDDESPHLERPSTTKMLAAGAMSRTSCRASAVPRLLGASTGTAMKALP
jgi:hypothetical protein